MTDLPRIDELKRRVRHDPASISFAALAEEYRRGGQFQEAIDVCREGLRHHPGYVSARVTLGRALLEVGEFDDARSELEYVLVAAPENLAATRALEEIRRRCDAASPVPVVQPGPARAAVLEIPRIPVSQTAPVDTEIAAAKIDTSQTADEHLHATATEPALSGLEEFLEAILRARRETEPSHEQRR